MILFESFTKKISFYQDITAKVHDETNAIFFITFDSKRDLVYVCGDHQINLLHAYFFYHS